MRRVKDIADEVFWVVVSQALIWGFWAGIWTVF